MERYCRSSSCLALDSMEKRTRTWYRRENWMMCKDFKSAGVGTAKFVECMFIYYFIFLKQKRKLRKTTNFKLVWSIRWRESTRMSGMNEKDTNRVLARDYFSDSWLVRFWQYLAYFSNKDYRNHEIVLSKTTRTKLGTRRLWITLFGKMLKVEVFGKRWKWTFIFNCEPGGPGSFEKKVTP